MKKIKKISFISIVGIITIFNLIAFTSTDSVGAAWTLNYPGWNINVDAEKRSACEQLQKDGLTKIAAAGIIGNVLAESGMNPYKREGVGNHLTYGLGAAQASRLDPDNDSFGPGRGLIQWGDGTGANGAGSSRWLNLVNYVNKKFGKNYPQKSLYAWNDNIRNQEANVRAEWPSATEQISFIQQEMRSGGYGSITLLNASATPESAARYFHDNFVKSREYKSDRGTNARDVYNRFCDYQSVKNYASMDNLEYRAGFIHARGWAFNTDLQPTYPTDLVAISYTAFLMDADRGIELARTAEGFYYRDDVANVFSRFKNVGYGGFKVKFQMQQGWEGKNVFLMIRFANDAAGNWPKVDDNYQLKDNKITLPKSDGGLDELTISNQGLRARGWHLSPIVVKYRYLFILDKNTGLELGRTRIVNTFRPDAGNLHPTYPNSTEGGFDVTLPIQSHWRGKEIFVMTRYTNNEAGDHAIDDISYPTRKIRIS